MHHTGSEATQEPRFGALVIELVVRRGYVHYTGSEAEQEPRFGALVLSAAEILRGSRLG